MDIPSSAHKFSERLRDFCYFLKSKSRELMFVAVFQMYLMLNKSNSSKEDRGFFICVISCLNPIDFSLQSVED